MTTHANTPAQPYNVLETPRNPDKLLAFNPLDAKEAIYNGCLQKGCMAKYWYTYFTDLPMDTKLTTDHINTFLDTVANDNINITSKIIYSNAIQDSLSNANRSNVVELAYFIGTMMREVENSMHI